MYRFIDVTGNTAQFGYFEGYQLLSSLEGYWYKVELDGDNIVITDIHGGGKLLELERYIIERIGQYDFYSVLEDYDSEMLKIEHI
jgi:hypothetical protein